MAGLRELAVRPVLLLLRAAAAQVFMASIKGL
jgi:hypothetical protein